MCRTTGSGPGGAASRSPAGCPARVSGRRQVRHREFGQRMLFSSGSRPTTTLRKLPTAVPRSGRRGRPRRLRQSVVPCGQDSVGGLFRRHGRRPQLPCRRTPGRAVRGPRAAVRLLRARRRPGPAGGRRWSGRPGCAPRASAASAVSQATNPFATSSRRFASRRTIPPPVATTVFVSFARSARTADSRSRNAGSPSAAKMSRMVLPARSSRTSSASRNGQPSRSARARPTVVLPDPR